MTTSTKKIEISAADAETCIAIIDMLENLARGLRGGVKPHVKDLRSRLKRKIGSAPTAKKRSS